MSLYNMSTKKIINNRNFVSEPVMNIIDRINSSDNKKIVLTGPRGGGRSIVINSYEKEMIHSGSDAIYMSLDSVIANQLLGEKHLMIRYELLLCSKILFYLKDYYYDEYKLYFKGIANEVKEMNKLVNDYVSNFKYKKMSFPNVISTPGILLESIISRMKAVIGNDKLTICLDRFDWINEKNSKNFQKMLEFYFDLFDKVIVTTDDKSVYDDIDNRRHELETHGIDVVEVSYGKDKDISRKIVKADIDYYLNLPKDKVGYNLNSNFNNIDNLIDKEVFDMIINKCDGNFNLLFVILREFFGSSWYNFDDRLANNRRIIRIFELMYKELIDEEKNSYAKKLYL